MDVDKHNAGAGVNDVRCGTLYSLNGDIGKQSYGTGACAMWNIRSKLDNDTDVLCANVQNDFDNWCNIVIHYLMVYTFLHLWNIWY